MKRGERIDRGILVGVLLVQARTDRAPSWTQLTRLLRLNRRKLVLHLAGMRRRGLVEYVDGVPGSLRVTEKGRRRALAGRADR